MEQDMKALITALIESLSQSDLAELELEQDGYRIRLTKAACAVGPRLAPPAAGIEAAPAATDPAQTPPETATNADIADDTLIEAPLHGTLRLQPAPGKPPFAVVGTTVRSGQTLATIEAMKMFHEVVSESDGVVLEVLAANGQEVSAGQALLRIGRI